MKRFLFPVVLLGVLLAPWALTTASAAEERSPFRTAELRTTDDGALVTAQPVRYGYRPYYGYRSDPRYGGYYGGYSRPYYGGGYYRNYYRPYGGYYGGYYGNYARPYGGYGSFYYGGPGVSFGIGW